MGILSMDFVHFKWNRLKVIELITKERSI